MALPVICHYKPGYLVTWTHSWFIGTKGLFNTQLLESGMACLYPSAGKTGEKLGRKIPAGESTFFLQFLF